MNLELVRSHRLVWAIVGLTVVINAASIWLALLDRHVQSLTATFMFAVFTIGFASIGALIVSRQRGNALGWLFIAVAIFFAVPHSLMQNYAVYTLAVSPGSLPGGMVAFWFSSSALDTVFIALMALLLLLFPNGRPATPRWRIAVWAGVIGAIAGIANGLTPMHGGTPLEHVTNPLATSGTVASLAHAANQLGGLLATAAAFAGVASVAVRFRRAVGIERQQIKWILAGGLFVAIVTLASIVMSALGLGDLSSLTFLLSLGLFPVLMGVAILRYRLYDIDVVIRRTLVYALLVAVLALVYLGGIAVLGAAFRAVTGQSGAITVTLSTLAVAVAFQPLRHRIQRAIDHRFARRAYDAEETVRTFTGRLREQIDLDVLCRELVGVVDETVQPRRASLWLRPAGDDRSGG
jgi:hypothetical protein